MNIYAIRQLGIAITLMLLSCGSAVGQLAIDWSTIDGGGAMSSTGGSFSVSGTIGQPDAASNPTLTGDSFELTGGFWPVTSVCYCLGDLNGDGQRDGLDVQKFVACMVVGGNCSCADVDQANGLTLADVPAFVTALLAGQPCPFGK